MPRAHLQFALSLVACPVERFPVTSQAQRTHFQPQHGPSPALPELDKQTGRVVNTEHQGR